MGNIMAKEKKLSSYFIEAKKINALDFEKQIRAILLRKSMLILKKRFILIFNGFQNSLQ